MFVTNWISTTKIQKYRRLPTFLGTISYPELRYYYLRDGALYRQETDMNEGRAAIKITYDE